MNEVSTAGEGTAKNLRDRTKAVAAKALRRMHDMGLAPTPQNYATWYAYYEGSNTDLVDEIDRLVAANGRVDPLETSRLHETYLADAGREALEEMSVQVSATIDSLMDDVGRAGEGARAYSEVLTGFSGEIEEGGAGSRAALAGILAETQRMAETNRRLEQRLNASAQEIQNLRTDLEKVREEANTDALTALPNRKCFDRTLRQRALEAGEQGRPLSLLALDIDHFKSFNDTHGHQTGDEVLRLVARTIRQAVPEGCLPARLGGEEFAVLVPRLGFDPSRNLAETIRRAVGGKKLRNLKSGATLGTITLSVGVSEYVVGEPLAAFFARADEALYLAKSSGRNRVCSERDLDDGAISV